MLVSQVAVEVISNLLCDYNMSYKHKAVNVKFALFVHL